MLRLIEGVWIWAFSPLITHQKLTHSIDQKDKPQDNHNTSIAKDQFFESKILLMSTSKKSVKTHSNQTLQILFNGFGREDRHFSCMFFVASVKKYFQ
jgi:hypothetical protein